MGDNSPFLSYNSKKCIKKVLDISESYGIFVNVYFGIKTILFKNNMKSKIIIFQNNKI